MSNHGKACSLCYLSAKNFNDRSKFDKVLTKNKFAVFLRHSVVHVRDGIMANQRFSFFSYWKLKCLSGLAVLMICGKHLHKVMLPAIRTELECEYSLSMTFNGTGAASHCTHTENCLSLVDNLHDSF